MPRTLAVDWSHLKALFVKGLSVDQLAKETGVPLGAIKQRCHRGKWVDCRKQAEIALSQVVTHDIAVSHSVKALKWVQRIDTYVNKALDSIEVRNHDKVPIRDLKLLVETAKIANDMARPTYGLDTDKNQGHTTNVLVMPSHLAGQPHSPPPLGTVIDIHALPSSTDSNPDPIEPSSNAS